MRIAIEDNVSSNRKWHPILDILLFFVDEGRHGFDASRSLDLMSSLWVSERPASVADMIRLSALERSTDDLVDASMVVVDVDCPRGGRTDFEQSTTRLHPLDAIIFLSTPFQVILENEVFDGAFLLWMAKALDFMKFIDAYRQGKFAFRHAGGKDSIERSAKTFANGVWSRRDGEYSRAFRLWMCAVLDNDARHENDFPNRHIIESTEPHVSFVHQLARRSIESYIPRDFLGKILRKQQVYALGRLNADQRRYYHMKKGFRFEKNDAPTIAEYKHTPKITTQEKKLFSSIPNIDWKELRSGFGGGLSAIFIEERYRPNVNDVRVCDMQDKQELLMLLKRIYERI